MGACAFVTSTLRALGGAFAEQPSSRAAEQPGSRAAGQPGSRATIGLATIGRATIGQGRCGPPWTMARHPCPELRAVDHCGLWVFNRILNSACGSSWTRGFYVCAYLHGHVDVSADFCAVVGLWTMWVIQTGGFISLAKIQYISRYLYIRLIHCFQISLSTLSTTLRARIVHAAIHA